MRIKKIGTLFLSLMLVFSMMAVSASALEPGAYKVTCNTNYYNPDTGEIDDGGTANAALGEGMCRSATATVALVEREGDSYYVTIRLLLQSNVNNARFWKHTGYNTYEEVSYDIMAENAAEDSVDYRFRVSDPFAPIKAMMYVTPMGRDTLWYIELAEAGASADTGDFVVSIDTTPSTEPAVKPTEKPQDKPTAAPVEPTEKPIESEKPAEAEKPTESEKPVESEAPTESETPVETEKPKEPKAEASEEPAIDDTVETSTKIYNAEEESGLSADTIAFVVFGAVVVLGLGGFLIWRKRK